jgi:hypothetical protein
MRVSIQSYLIALIVPMALGGCASVSVSNLVRKGVPPKALPQRIYIQEFSFPASDFNVGREGQALEKMITSEKHTIAIELSKQIAKRVAPCTILPKNKPLPKGNFWLLRGNYVQVYQGSRALRILIGFGAGKTTMETDAVFLSLASAKPSPFLSLKTSGGSGLSPGVVGAMNPAGALSFFGALGNALGASFGGLSMDRNRSAREIAAALSEYCYQQNLLSENCLRRPKMLHHAPPLQWPELHIPFMNP